jgi:hypothetical protein
MHCMSDGYLTEDLNREFIKKTPGAPNPRDP